MEDDEYNREQNPVEAFMNSEARKLSRDLQRMLKTNRYNLLLHGATISQHKTLSTLVLEISARGCKDEQKTIHIPCEKGATYDSIFNEYYTRITREIQQGLPHLQNIQIK